jgi:hypothetical protein
MSDGVTNGDLMTAILGLKGDVGGLLASSTLQLAAINDHNKRIGVLEDGASQQKGRTRLVAAIAAGAGALAGTLPAFAKFLMKH